MHSVEKALSRILAHARPLPIDHMRLMEAHGRVLATDVRADIAMPPFTNSAVDGYAVRAADTRAATPMRPVLLTPVAGVAAGEAPVREVGAGEAARVLTGAPLPPGADAVVMQEDTAWSHAGQLAVKEAADAGQHLRVAGSDTAAGATVLRQGAQIGAAEIALLASVRTEPSIPVYRRPRVAVVSTGDELVDIDMPLPLPPGKIRDSNRYALAALTQEAGGEVCSVTRLPDDLEQTVDAFRALAAAPERPDLIVAAGGVSVGDRDFVKPAIERLGALELWRVRMKPGKPLAFGWIEAPETTSATRASELPAAANGRILFFGLPGNPVSAMVTFELFVRPVLWKLAGVPESRLQRPCVRARISEAIPHIPGRREFVRATITIEAGGFAAVPTGSQGSSRAASMVGANGLVIVPEEWGDAPAGAELEAVLIGSL